MRQILDDGVHRDHAVLADAVGHHDPGHLPAAGKIGVHLSLDPPPEFE